jgi:hypothetical protein
MVTEIVILAQGQRLGAHGLAPLQPLPYCGGVPVLCRTIRQVNLLQAGSPDGMWWPKVVTWGDVKVATSWPNEDGRFTVTPSYDVLPEPGNSALKGIARYLELRDHRIFRYDRTIILLGDVVYSWACLRAIWEMSKIAGFVGTRNLALEKGELWGVAWSRALEDRMMSDLRDALLRHPPLDDGYHHSQLRRWISGWRRGDLSDHIAKLRKVDAYVDIDDYTHDIDAASDLVLLPELSSVAASDDAQHNVQWKDVMWECGNWALPDEPKEDRMKGE